MVISPDHGYQGRYEASLNRYGAAENLKTRGLRHYALYITANRLASVLVDEDIETLVLRIFEIYTTLHAPRTFSSRYITLIIFV